MLYYQFNEETGLLHLRPNGPLSEKDIEGIADIVDPYIDANGSLPGLIIEADAFPGWQDLATAIRHLRFIHDHHRRIKKIAVVTDSAIGDFAEVIAAHFVAAEIRHFAAHHDLLAHDWILSR
jgi:hypothetical protein